MSRVSAPWSARAKPQAWRSMWGWASSGREAALLYFRKRRLTVERCKGLCRSLTKNAFTLVRTLLRARAFMSFPFLNGSGALLVQVGIPGNQEVSCLQRDIDGAISFC